MPVTYAKPGIQFEYPDNWTLDEEEARDSRNAATVYAPTGAFWSVNLQPSGDADPTALVDSVLETLRQEYPDLDGEPVIETVEGRNLIGYEANFYCLDLTNTAQIRAVQSPFGIFVILAQAEDREYQRLSPVFQAMTISLLRNSLGKGARA